MKNPTLLIVITTLLLGVGFLGFLVANNRDDAKRSSDVVELAAKLNLDIDKFIQDYESQELVDLVEAQRQDALNRLGGSAYTPSVFINGSEYKRTAEISTLQTLQALVDEASEEDSSTELPIVVEVFEDYNCSACAAYQADLYEVEQAFDESQVVIQKKHLPFLKDSSEKYARAAEAARKQSKFDDYHIELYKMNFSNIDFSYYTLAE